MIQLEIEVSTYTCQWASGVYEQLIRLQNKAPNWFYVCESIMGDLKTGRENNLLFTDQLPPLQWYILCLLCSSRWHNNRRTKATSA